MELDILKSDWEATTNQGIKANILTSKTIDQMTLKKYRTKIKKIKYPEFIGGIVCFMGLSFIGFNFSKLDTHFFQAIGILSILLLIILPLLSFLSLIQFSTAGNLDKPYIETIQQFANQKIRFQKFQKANAFLSYLLLVATVILLPKFFSGKDITFSKSFWTFAFSFGYIFLLFFSKWVKKYYSNSLRQAEELLKETQP